MRLLERPEIGPLEVLDKGELELLTIGELPNHRGDPFETCHLARAETAFSRDELIAVDGLRHEDRLKDAVLADAGRESLELGRVESLPRLAGIRTDPRQWNLGRRNMLAALRNQGGQAAAEPAVSFGVDRHACAARAAASMACRSADPDAANAFEIGDVAGIGRSSRSRSSRASSEYA